MIVDTHAHLTAKEFKKDLDVVLREAQENGISRIICVTEDLDEIEQALQLEKHFPMVKVGVGLFPTHLNLEKARQVVEFIGTNAERLLCIGEVGLDFWKVKDEAQRCLQEQIFIEFIKSSKATGLPLNCHSRSAGRRIIELLLKYDAPKVQLHAFDAKVGTALKGQEAGFFFSIPPSIIRSRQKQKLVKALPLESLLVESDAPVLGPDPNVRNVPSNVLLSLEAISELKEEPLEKVREVIWENSKRLYGNEL